VVFTALIALGTGLLFGLFPLLHSTRPDLITGIRAGAGQIAGGARVATRFRSTLVTAQIALSMALLVTAGLFIKSLGNVSRIDLGIRTDHLLAFTLAPELNGYAPSRSAVFFRSAEDVLRALPGVTAVTASRVPTLAGSNWGSSVSVEGFEKTPDTDADSRYNQVGAGYFHTMGIPLLAGRDFTAGDIAGGPKVAIVYEAFAKKFGLVRNPVGKHMSEGGKDLDIEIDWCAIPTVRKVRCPRSLRCPTRRTRRWAS
jgi:hypothetical protein